MIMGNSPDYILLYGGSTQEFLPGDFDIYKLKKTLTDLWVFHTGTRQWQELFVNSVENPPPRDGAAMTILKEDRMAMIFGG